MLSLLTTLVHNIVGVHAPPPMQLQPEVAHGLLSFIFKQMLKFTRVKRRAMKIILTHCFMDILRKVMNNIKRVY